MSDSKADRYTRDEVAAAVRDFCYHDVDRVLRRLDENRVDARQKAALATMRAVAEELKGATGSRWLALQADFTRALAESDAAQAEADRLHEARTP